MAKKKADGNTRLSTLLAAAKTPHQFDAGVGGDPYELLDNVRGIRLPSLGLMEMLGFTALRDSCTVLVDGDWGSNKSSFAIDMFNWGLPYGGGGALFDCENKGAFDIAHGMLNSTILWLPGHFIMRTCENVEKAQGEITALVGRCKKLNEGLPRNEHVPYIQVTDSLAGISSEETLKAVAEQGYSDRGHAGRSEALLWSTFMKSHQTQLCNVPMISVFINHLKERSKQVGRRSVNEKYNPGGVAQNYHATIHFRCEKVKSYVSDAVDGTSWDQIRIRCAKNSRGPTGKITVVRKCSIRRPDGTTQFWWDWGSNTAEFLMGLPSSHPASKLVNIKKGTANRGSCDEVCMTNEPLSDIGDAIMSDEALFKELVSACRIYQLKEFTRLTEEEYTQLSETAQVAREAYESRKRDAED